MMQGEKLTLEKIVWKRSKNRKKNIFLIFGISHREIAYSRRENRSKGFGATTFEVMKEVRDFRGRYLSIQNDRCNLTKVGKDLPRKMKNRHKI